MKKTIWTIVESHAGGVRPVSYEIIAFAAKIAERIDADCAVAVIGHPVKPLAETVAKYTGCRVAGIDAPGAEIYNAEIYRKLLADFFGAESPLFILIPHTATGSDFAPSLAVDLSASNITAATGFKIDGEIVFTRQTCNGKIIEDIAAMPGAPAVITVMPGSADPFCAANNGKGKVEIIEMPAPKVSSRTLEYVENPSKSASLREAEVIVSAGRGIADPSNLDMIRELAGLFRRGVVGGSRPVCDANWLGLESQVGITGTVVSPKLYIACGISGAVQHTMGMKNSKMIVAINTDRNALICRTAQYCVASDLKQFIPVLIRAIKEYKKGT